MNDRPRYEVGHETTEGWKVEARFDQWRFAELHWKANPHLSVYDNRTDMFLCGPESESRG